MKTVSLTIDGEKIEAREGESLLWTALDNGHYVPNLCGLRDSPEPTAACRLCFVEVEGRKGPVTACTETVSEGMVVETRGERGHQLARSGFELIMASHAQDCADCTKSGNCELQRIAHHLHAKLKSKRLRKLERGLPADDGHGQLVYDPNKCVLCGRCVARCREHSGVGVLGFAHRGFERVVATFGDESLGGHDCDHCLECTEVCPTGALMPKNETSAVGGHR